MRWLAFMLLVGTATPAVAQDHSGHAMPDAQPSAQTECEAEAARHRAMGHPVAEGACAPAAQPAEPVPADRTDGHSGMDHSGMDHSVMDHSAMDHGQMHGMDQSAMEDMDHSAMGHESMQSHEEASMDHRTKDHGTMDHGAMDMTPIPQGPPPASAGSGPPRAADAIWGAEAMRASRSALRKENGGMTVFWFQGDRAEYRVREGGDGYLWDVQGYYGGDLDKFWFKSEGEGTFGESPESAEIQAMWSHAIGPWWDLQAGVRQDLTGPRRTHAAIGVQGLAPYMFEVDAAAFLSTKGDLTARIEAELDQRVTQRLILQPRAELSLSAQDVPELGIGAGLDSIELGLRLRYEFAREFAPYVGIEQEWKLDQSADYARIAGEDPSVTNYVVGVRFWF
ncbi:copper resistance protein B [Croceicoccus naphthovorans]|uniref:Copper resistance protein CopB n=1 Tax=Croceicoccus naphthovorans TaxID=1348774 RepID=A0A0G3XIQ6_9SPHN|nr:copper resistance protein B [Croceicoccus naphthovorans]AKM10228.1 copper resistance protein CopB [Croceicoccus naphthovorans]MBB3990510.1 copper resistance protein B [Croceicoccus naphthovorans]